MKAHELVPEACHQKFKTYHKQENQIHVEFAHEKELYFDIWCNSREVGIDFEKLRPVLLIEQFKTRVCDGTKTDLDEQKTENWQKLAAYPEAYTPTHYELLS